MSKFKNENDLILQLKKLTGLDKAFCKKALDKSDWDVKTAIRWLLNNPNEFNSVFVYRH